MSKSVPQLLLAHEWDGEMDPTGWWMSEKLDGVRAYWDGKRLLSRLGNQFQAPKWFTKGWPSIPMDGELWMGRKMFDQTSGAVRKLTPVDAEWKKIKYLVFDVPSLGKGFEHRLHEVQRIARSLATKGRVMKIVQPVHHWICEGQDDLRKELERVVQMGGEGLMLRMSHSAYEPKRSKSLLKVKQWQTTDGIVVGHEPGKGKHKGRLGALVVSLRPITQGCAGVSPTLLKVMQKPSEKTVNVGTGFTDAQRCNPPKVGSVVTYKFFELTKDGIPRFPAYVGVRHVS